MDALKIDSQPAAQLSVPDGKVLDYIDGKIRPDTPEEYVRQNIEKRIINELGYTRDRVSVEYGIKLGSARPRVDVAIFLKDKPKIQDNVHIVVECKKENINPADKRDGVGQLKSYMAASLNCEWGLWTNGKQREVWRKVRTEDGKEEFVEFNDIPSALGNIEDIDRPKRGSLRDAVGDNLMYAFKSAHNSIHVIDGFQKEQAFFELLKIIFCKISDERNIPYPLDFYVTSGERATPDGQLACKKRIDDIFERVKANFSQIFDKNDEIKLKPRSLVRIVAEFQGYSFLATDIDIKGRAYEEVVGSNLKGDRGQFFTPRNIMQMAVEMINPSIDEKILDPACGTGGFLVTSMNRIIDGLQSDWEQETGKDMHEWSHDERKYFMDRISQIAKKQFFGFDISPELVRATKMNMVMNNDGSGNIFHSDSLLSPHEWPSEFRDGLVRALGEDAGLIASHKNIDLFDVILTNPPFGSKIVIDDRTVLDQYDLARIWEKPTADRPHWLMTDRFQSGVPPEQLFIERCVQLLKPGGRMAIVLPDSILGSPGLGYIRQWLLENVVLVGSVDLNSDTFQPHTGVQTSILILRKKTLEEKAANIRNEDLNYNVFLSIVNKVGHDKRGVTIYKRDEYGNEILKDQKQVNYVDGRAIETISKVKIVDDETPDVNIAFTQWKKEQGLNW